MSENIDAVEIYERLNKGNHIYREEEQGKQRRMRAYIDMKLALSLAQAYNVQDVPAFLDKLDIIHSEIYK